MLNLPGAYRRLVLSLSGKAVLMERNTELTFLISAVLFDLPQIEDSAFMKGWVSLVQASIVEPGKK